MLIAHSRWGQLGNRLQLAAYVSAVALECQRTIALLCLGEHRRFFAGSADDALCRLPARPAAWWTAAALLPMRIAAKAPGLPRYSALASPGLVLETPERLARIRRTPVLALRGYYFYAPALLRAHAPAIREYFQLAPPFADSVARFIAGARARGNHLVGVHVRQGDYAEYRGGEHFFTTAQYARLMHVVREALQPGSAHFIVCSDTPQPEAAFAGLSWQAGPGSAIGDLYALAGCDYVMGPTSTFNRWSAFAGNVPRYEIRDPARSPSLSDFAPPTDLTVPEVPPGAPSRAQGGSREFRAAGLSDRSPNAHDSRAHLPLGAAGSPCRPPFSPESAMTSPPPEFPESESPPAAAPPVAAAHAPHVELWRDILKYFPGVILPRLAGFVSVPIITRLFPPEIYGTYALVLANITVLSSAALSGIGSALLRFLPAHEKDPESEGRLLTTVFMLATIVSVVVVAAGLAVLGLTGRFSKRFGVLMGWGLLMFFSTGLLALLSIVLRSQRKAGFYSALQLMSGYGGLAIGLALILGLGFGIQGLIIGNAIAALAGVLLAWRVAMRGQRIAMHMFSPAIMREIFRFSLFISLGNAAYWLLSLSDRWLLRLFRGAEEVGLYSVSYDLTSKTTMLFVAAFGLALQPLSITAWESRGRAAAEAFLASSTRTYLLVMMPATVGLSMLASALVGLMAAPEYQPGAVIVPWIAAAMFLYGLLDIAGRGLTLNKRPDIEARNFLIAGLVSVGINLIFMPRFGILSAAGAATVGYFTLLLLHAAAARAHATWRFPWRTVARAALACVAMGIVVLLIRRALADAPRGVDVAAAALGGLLTYGVAITALGELSPARVMRVLFSALR
jgi:O-antigen/teichoic acid export membrane protein